ncbi:MAG: hypothetical protein WCI20_08805 [bacterium]
MKTRSLLLSITQTHFDIAPGGKCKVVLTPALTLLAPLACLAPQNK